MNWTLLQNSLVVSGGATLLAVSIGFITALWAVTLQTGWQQRLLIGAVIAVAMPPFLVTSCWLHFFGLTGVWRSWLPLNIYSLDGTIWILALLTWPISLFAALSAWKRLESAQLESDPALAGGALIRWLLWPMARASLVQAAVLTFVLTLNNFAVPAILQVKVFPAEVWVKFSTNFSYLRALATGWPLIAAPLLLLLVLRRAEINWPRQTGAAAALAIRRQLGRCWVLGTGLIGVAVLLVSLVLPLVQIVAVQRTWSEMPNVIRAVPGVIWNSFAFSAATACACVLIALALRRPAWRTGSGDRAGQTGAVRWARRPAFLFSLFLWLPMLTPGVLLGIVLIFLFNHPTFEAIYRGSAIVIIAWTLRYLALGWSGVGASLRSVDSDLTDAARLDGASGWSLLRHVLFPQMAAQVGAAWYVTYLLCLWDVETLILIYPPGGETLALRIFNLLHYGHNAQVSALCLLLLMLAVAPLAGWSVWRRFSRRTA